MRSRARPTRRWCPRACTAPSRSQGLHQEEAEATATLSIGSHGSKGNVTRILDLQTHEAIADLDAAAPPRARRQLRMTHAVGHELGDEQLRIIEHLVGDLGIEPRRDRRSRRRRSVQSGRDDDLQASHSARGHGRKVTQRGDRVELARRDHSCAEQPGRGAGRRRDASRGGVESPQRVSSVSPRGPAQDAGGPEASPRVDTGASTKPLQGQNEAWPSCVKLKLLVFWRW